MADQPPDEEQDSPEEARAHVRSSAQGTAADLARMGIDPRLLGLEAAPDRTPEPPASTAPGAPQRPAQPPGHNVVPLRESDSVTDSAQLPASGTSRAWSAEPPPLTGSADQTPGAGVLPVDGVFGSDRPGRATSSQVRRLARAVTLGLLTPDAAEAAEHERRMATRVRTRQTDHRVVAFVAGKGGVGTTTVALGVGCVLAALRDDASTVVSLRTGAPSISRALGGDGARTVRELIAESEEDPSTLPNGLRVVDAPGWGTPVRRDDLPVLIDRLSQDSTLSLFDLGTDLGESADGLFSRADQLVIVCGPGVANREAAHTAAERAADVDPYLLDSAVYVVVCSREQGMKRVASELRRDVPPGGRVVAVPPDPALADGAPLDPSRLRAQTRLALIDIAGLVALGSASEGEPR